MDLARKDKHAQVHTVLGKIQPLRAAWAETAGVELGEQLASAYENMFNLLVVHLRREVVEIVPVAEKVVSAKEWNQLADRGRKAIPASRLMLQLGLLLAAAPLEERRSFFTALPKPVQLMYRLFGRRQFTKNFSQLFPHDPVPETI